MGNFSRGWFVTTTICVMHDSVNIHLEKINSRWLISLPRNSVKNQHLLFMDDLKLFGKSEDQIDSLVQSVQLFSEDTGMEFGLKKCGVLLMKRGKKVRFDGITLLDGRIMREIEEEVYKYLGFLRWIWWGKRRWKKTRCEKVQKKAEACVEIKLNRSPVCVGFLEGVLPLHVPWKWQSVPVSNQRLCLDWIRSCTSKTHNCGWSPVKLLWRAVIAVDRKAASVVEAHAVV